jgi:ATP-dependent Zn protease
MTNNIKEADRKGPTKLSIAYHEAGHAIVGLRLGFKVESAQVYKEYGHDGIVYWTDPDHRQWRTVWGNRSVRSIMVSQAGEVAERLSPDPFAGEQQEWSGDQRHIRSAALKACKGDQAKADELIAQLYRQTEELVLQNRSAIERVAIALLEKNLTGDDIKRIDGGQWKAPTLEEVPYIAALKQLYAETQSLMRRL